MRQTIDCLASSSSRAQKFGPFLLGIHDVFIGPAILIFLKPRRSSIYLSVLNKAVAVFNKQSAVQQNNY